MSPEVHRRQLKACLLLTCACCATLLSAVMAAPASQVLLKGDPDSVNSDSRVSVLPSSDSTGEQLTKPQIDTAKMEALTDKDTGAGVLASHSVDSDKVAAGADNAKGAVDAKGVPSADHAEASDDTSHSPSNDALSNQDETNSTGEYSVTVRAFNAGAVWRGFLVFVGCSVLVVLYLGVRTACRRCRRGQRRYRKVDRSDDLAVFPLTEAGDDDEEIFSADVQR